jgi:hypothetical protein
MHVAMMALYFLTVLLIDPSSPVVNKPWKTDS